MIDKDPAQQSETDAKLDNDALKRLAKLSETAIQIYINNHKSDDLGEISLDKSVEHRAMVDEIPDGATVTVAATKDHKIFIHKSPTNGIIGSFSGGICFTGVRARDGVPDALLRLDQFPYPEYFIELEASNYDGEYTIRDVQLPADEA